MYPLLRNVCVSPENLVFELDQRILHLLLSLGDERQAALEEFFK